MLLIFKDKLLLFYNVLIDFHLRLVNNFIIFDYKTYVKYFFSSFATLVINVPPMGLLLMLRPIIRYLFEQIEKLSGDVFPLIRRTFPSFYHSRRTILVPSHFTLDYTCLRKLVSQCYKSGYLLTYNLNN